MAERGAGKSLVDLPPKSIEMMGIMLSFKTGKNYKDLAGMFGYTQQEVEIIEAQCGASPPGVILLREYSKKPLATVAVLRAYLEKLQRYDIIKILDSGTQDFTDLVVVVKDKSGNFVRCYCVYAESSKTVKEAFEADKNMKQLMESLICDMSVMDMNVSSFKGMELSFVVDKEKISVASRYDGVSPMASENHKSNITHDASHYKTIENKLCGDYMTTAAMGFDADERIPGYHSEAVTNDEISRLLEHHLNEDNSFIVRPSRSNPADRCISVVSNQNLINYRIHQAHNKKYFLFKSGPYFGSLSALISHYSDYPITEDPRTSGPKLKCPIN